MTDALQITSLDAEHHTGLLRLMERIGADEPARVGTPSMAALQDLTPQRIAADASRDDAESFIALQGDEAVGALVLRFPRWDAAHFGYPIARIEHFSGEPQALDCLAAKALELLDKRGAAFCSARLSNDDLTAINCLERAGFRYRELILSPWRDLSTWRPQRHGVTRPTETSDLERIRSIARTAFRTDRFHRDKRFSPEAADGVYEKWVRTWHDEPAPNRFSRVLTLDDDVVGFFLFEITSPAAKPASTVARIVLNGVDPTVAGRGYGLKMYCDALDEVSSLAAFAVADVAAANPAALNLYRKLGFSLSGSGRVTLHRWSHH